MMCFSMFSFRRVCFLVSAFVVLFAVLPNGAQNPVRVFADSALGQEVSGVETTAHSRTANITGEPTPVAVPTVVQTAKTTKSSSNVLLLASGFLGGLSLAILIAVIVIILRRRTPSVAKQPDLPLLIPISAQLDQGATVIEGRKSGMQSPDPSQIPTQRDKPPASATVRDHSISAATQRDQPAPVKTIKDQALPGETFWDRTDSTIDQTVDEAPEYPSKKAICLLTIQTSDDLATIGKIYRLERLPVRIGRSSECEVGISKQDHKVSRLHALLSRKRNRVFINEIESIDESGQQHLPRYHTYVNNVQIYTAPIALHNGDVIRLGQRLTILFEYLND